MIIYRGVKDILFKNINPLYQNQDDFNLDFGKGTSYSYQKDLAMDYVVFNKTYAWFLTYEFSPKNELYIDFNSLFNEDSISEGFFINHNFVAKKDISKYANSNGHDCILFEYDEEDTHILLLNSAIEPALTEVELHTDNEIVIEKIKTQLKLSYFDGFFAIPLGKLKEIDDILENI